jgi:hypothetical protein
MNPSWRKPAGALGILAYLTLWIVLIASFAGAISTWPTLAQAAVYLVAGIVWILPLGPVLRWMETGRWRA